MTISISNKAPDERTHSKTKTRRMKEAFKTVLSKLIRLGIKKQGDSKSFYRPQVETGYIKIRKILVDDSSVSTSEEGPRVAANALSPPPSLQSIEQSQSPLKEPEPEAEVSPEAAIELPPLEELKPAPAAELLPTNLFEQECFDASPSLSEGPPSSSVSQESV
jgi:hypothetical protein